MEMKTNVNKENHDISRHLLQIPGCGCLRSYCVRSPGNVGMAPKERGVPVWEGLWRSHMGGAFLRKQQVITQLSLKDSRENQSCATEARAEPLNGTPGTPSSVPLCHRA